MELWTPGNKRALWYASIVVLVLYTISDTTNAWFGGWLDKEIPYISIKAISIVGILAITFLFMNANKNI